ncbi:hypothetical protein C6499_00360 [Candidatus Poribacteria bacterium]|nr:MAG: hypothetical protein C6499_00360 [Candidatus Poribacteria bacterium]
MRYELFSKREKRIRGEVPDVYQYETIPPGLRVQVVYIWKDIWGEVSSRAFRRLGCPMHAYEFIHQTLCRGYSIFRLEKGSDFDEAILNFLLSTEATENVIDVIEVSFRYIDRVVRNNLDVFIRNSKSSGYKNPRISPDEAIDELNYQFREHGVGFQYESGRIIKADSQFVHSEVVKPALLVLSDPMFKGADEEFLKAHEHYRKGRYKECLNECLKAFESCLKTICKKRGWQYDDKRNTAKDLIQIVFDNELIPSFMQSHFSALKSTLESGLPTVRNRQAGHGQGSTQIIVPEYIAGYALHLTASNILLLAKADEKMK